MGSLIQPKETTIITEAPTAGRYQYTYTNLREIDFKQNAKIITIPEYHVWTAQSYNTNLTKVTGFRGTTIGKRAFCNSVNLTYFEGTQFINVESIGEYAFWSTDINMAAPGGQWITPETAPYIATFNKDVVLGNYALKGYFAKVRFNAMTQPQILGCWNLAFDEIFFGAIDVATYAAAGAVASDKTIFSLNAGKAHKWTFTDGDYYCDANGNFYDFDTDEQVVI